MRLPPVILAVLACSHIQRRSCVSGFVARNLPATTLLDLEEKGETESSRAGRLDRREHRHQHQHHVCHHESHESGRREAIGSTAVALAALLVPTGPALGLSPQEASAKYDSYASNYDQLDGGTASSVLGIDEARTELFAQARGDVLEIGVGTGLNLPKYDPTKITSLTLVDISTGMLDQAKARVDAMPELRQIRDIRYVIADATSELASRFGERSFDSVVDSFSLCVMGNQGAEACLSQLGKVVKTKQDGGKILLVENSRSSNPILGLYQDATAEAAANAGGKGCVYNQDIRAMIRKVGGITIDSEKMYAAGLFRSFSCSVIN